jgi:hypothetical protein
MNHLIKQAEELAKQRAGGQVPVSLKKRSYYCNSHGSCTPETRRYGQCHAFCTPETTGTGSGMVSALLKPADTISGMVSSLLKLSKYSKWYKSWFLFTGVSVLWNHHAGTVKCMVSSLVKPAVKINGMVSVLPKPAGTVSSISHGFCIQNGFLTTEQPCRYNS